MNTRDAAKAMVEQGKCVVDGDGDVFRYNKEVKCFEMYRRQSGHWIFWCKGPKLESYENDSDFKVHPGIRGQERAVVTGWDGNGSTVEA